MKENHTISVIMSVYNTDEKWLRESIESILGQSFADFEFIIILDCPTDNSEAIVREYARRDSRIRILVNEENLGLTKSLNRGLSAANGSYIARMDADDISVKTRFEKQAAYLDSHLDTVAVGSRCYLPVSRKPVINDWTEDQGALAVRLLFANAGLPHSSAMIRRSALEQNHIQYTESIRKSQDYKLWVDLLPHGKLIVMPEILLIYREHEGQISANRSSQFSYAHQVSLMQAEKLLGELSDSEKKLHVTVMETELPASAGELDRYFRKIASANQQKKIYRQDKLIRELDYLWCRKAIRRVAVERKTDMLFHWRTLRILSPQLIRYIRENKSCTEAYRAAIRGFEKNQ